jgi:hypothetical protein
MKAATATLRLHRRGSPDKQQSRVVCTIFDAVRRRTQGTRERTKIEHRGEAHSMTLPYGIAPNAAGKS